MESIRDFIWDLLTNDDGLKSAMGGEVRMFNARATPDANLPYIVHRLNAIPDLFWPVVQSSYYIDIWTSSDKTDQAYAIRNGIVELLDQRKFTIEGDITRGEIWLQTDGMVPDPTDGIFHYVLQFNIRYYRSAEAERIINR